MTFGGTIFILMSIYGGMDFNDKPPSPFTAETLRYYATQEQCERWMINRAKNVSDEQLVTYHGKLTLHRAFVSDTFKYVGTYYCVELNLGDNQ